MDAWEARPGDTGSMLSDETQVHKIGPLASSAHIVLHFRAQPYDFPNQDFIFLLDDASSETRLQRLLLRMFRYGRLHAVETPLVVSFFFRFEFLEAVKATVGSQ